MLITPKSAVELVLNKKTKEFQLHLYETNLQKWAFYLAIGTFTAGFAGALISYFWENQSVAFFALLLLLLSTVFVIAYQMASVLPEFYKLRNVEKEISHPLVEQFNEDMDLIRELAATYETHHLHYAEASYVRMARQLRERISILVGAIEKVGVIPLVITGYLSYAKAKKDGLLTFDGIEWLLIAFLVLYLLAIRMSSTVQWMEKVAELYRQAISLRTSKND